VDDAFQLGSWLVQPTLNVVSRNGTTLQLEPKVMAVLICLAEHPNDLVSKEKILQTVWPDTFVSESVLTRSISELRRAFEDEAKEPRVIQTIAKRGYRLVAPVSRVNTEQGVSQSSSGIPSKTQSSWRRAVTIGVAMFVIVVLVVGLMIASRPYRSPDKASGGPGSPEIRSLAVLPMDNLSHDEDQEYFADGLTDALITELSQIRALRVISRTSITKYKGEKKMSLPQIGRELNVDWIVEGTVQRSGDRVRITVQLIHAPADRHLWARSYDKARVDTLSIEQEIAAGVAEEIAVQLSPREKARLREVQVTDPAVVEAYLKGKYQVEQVAGPWGPGHALEMARGFTKALEYYRDALDRSPTYVPARIATARVLLNWVPVVPQKASKARAELVRTLNLDPQNAEAHMLLGQSAMYQDFDWLAAEREFKLAIELNPNLAEAHTSYATYLDALGRFDEASREWLQVEALDPDEVSLSDRFRVRRQYDRDIELNKARIERQAYFMSPHWELGIVYERTGRQQEAILEWETVLDAFNYKAGADAMRRSWKAGGYKAAVAAFAKFAEERAQSRTDYVDPGLVAYLMAISGNIDRAFFWLRTAYGARNTFRGIQDLTTLKVDPVWDPIRQDPRFKELIDNVGFPK